MYHDSKMYLFNNSPPRAMPNNFYLSRNCIGSPANKGWSTVNYLQSLAFDCPHLSCHFASFCHIYLIVTGDFPNKCILLLSLFPRISFEQS